MSFLFVATHTQSKPIKYRLRDEVIKGLVSGKLYSFALANLYNETLGATNGDPGHGLCLWEIIKILSRRGVYVAQPSDMKLTEGTLRQKPIKIVRTSSNADIFCEIDSLIEKVCK